MAFDENHGFRDYLLSLTINTVKSTHKTYLSANTTKQTIRMAFVKLVKKSRALNVTPSQS